MITLQRTSSYQRRIKGEVSFCRLKSDCRNCSIELTHRYYKRVIRDTQLPRREGFVPFTAEDRSLDRSDQHRRIDLAVYRCCPRRLNLSANAKSHLTLAIPECFRLTQNFQIVSATRSNTLLFIKFKTRSEVYSHVNKIKIFRNEIENTRRDIRRRRSSTNEVTR